MEKYSVLMSVYYREKAKYLEEAIMSMLNQSIGPSDFVIVCDGPLDEELDKVIADVSDLYKGLFQIIRLPQNQGLGIALKEGIKKCKYELVARMDSDDIAENDRIEKQLKCLKNNPDVSVVGGQILEFNDRDCSVTGYRCVPLKYEEILKRIATRNPMNHVTVLLKKSYVLEAGSYREFDKFEDYDLWIRMLARGFKFINIDNICVRVRVNESLYKRRSGKKYFKETVRLQSELLENKFINRVQFVINIIIRFIGTILIPNGLRKALYNTVLRKKSLNL